MTDDAPSPALAASIVHSVGPSFWSEMEKDVQRLPYTFEDGPLVYPANAFDSRLGGDWVPLGSSPTKSQKNFSGWRPVIAFLYIFLFHSLLRLTSFLSQNKNEYFLWATG